MPMIGFTYSNRATALQFSVGTRNLLGRFGEQGLYFLGDLLLSFWQHRLAEREPMLLNCCATLQPGTASIDLIVRRHEDIAVNIDKRSGKKSRADCHSLNAGMSN
ncbi:hypothetical protein METHB2_580022 [Candidatus Methylobacter favarea]|uniref:Uncharacterized protein n=1 Tax=Candidatus Methylobacter favarea TaxID=2707345 RepID=A0A8S0WKM7_9GAMM|nr:hypothetical protein [Candidatus Methylobacter favarea]CAA9892080.1 hypothetical protein METHB2_580022 [Candidatus Methylobacter favarea]